MPTISHLEALEILDCRGIPTLEVSCVLDGHMRGNATAPSAGTRGPLEVSELRDADEARHRGQGCRKAVALVEGEIREALVGKRFGDQAALDKALRLLDPSAERARIGGNTTFAVSLAFARAHASLRGVPLYRHFGDLIAHSPARLPLPLLAVHSFKPSPAADRGPLGLSVIPSDARSIDDALSFGMDLRRSSEALTREKFDDRGGLAPDGGIEAPFYDTSSVLHHAELAVRACPGERRDVEWVLRGNGTRRYDAGYYRVDREKLTAKEIADRLLTIIKRYPIGVMIDPLGHEDWEAWVDLTARLPASTLTAGDDLFATNLVRVEKAVTEKAARALVVKPGQTSSLTDAARTVRFARKAGLVLIVSARSGETEDDWITDLAIGWGAEYLQAGALAGSERLAKYNRLLAIEKKTRWPIYRRMIEPR